MFRAKHWLQTIGHDVKNIEPGMTQITFKDDEGGCLFPGGVSHHKWGLQV